MTLIIAEKPSLARNIAAAIGASAKRQGYLEGNGYLVTWAFGHLFSLCDVEDYTGGERGGKWSMEGLPCFPEHFRFRLRQGEDKKTDPGVQRQFECIRALLARADVDKVVNAGDADREGEIIVRIAVREAGGTDKPFLRLWLPDQTPETVQSAVKDLKPESEYDTLAGEGMARTYIDWLYGVNLTRYATLKTGTLLRVGRVIVPIVKAIYDRDTAIESFTPETYYVARSAEKTGEHEVELVSKEKFSDKAKALSYAEKLNSLPAVVKNARSARTTLAPGKLYSLSKLQNVLGKRYKMSMDQSLKIIQGLYEKGFVTYPRTNSEYLATAEKDKIRTILGNLKGLGYPVEFKDGTTIFDDKKIESHSALTPTYKIPKPDALSDQEKTVYQTVLRRFVAVFCSEKCVCRKSEITVSVGDAEDFVLKGTVILEKGWTRFDEAEKKDKLLPDLKEGDRVNTSFAPTEKKTSPP
ncbi:MAG: DNA topoisomerase III, partial [Clostridia bacterium]|nr:DNA topoisomerase III [Clostridia bacterium]